MSARSTSIFGVRSSLVTGVGRAGQIGNAVALAFGKAGAKIVACDHNAVGVAHRVREFAAEGVDARPCAGDLTQPDIAALAVEIALKHFGRLDVVVNVAGGLTTYGPIEQTTVQALDREIAINLKTTVLVSQAAIEALSQTPWLHHQLLARSPTSILRVPWRCTRAAKAAVAGFTRSLALELKDRHIRVNAVAPAMVRTVGQCGRRRRRGCAVRRDGGDHRRGDVPGRVPAGAPTGQILPISPVAAGPP